MSDKKVSDGELEIGDKIVTNQKYGSGIEIHVIDRITPTTYVTKTYVFKKDGLKIVGADKFGPYRGRIPTENDLMKDRIQKASILVKKVLINENNIDLAEKFIAEAYGK